jgi:DNA polymerase III epsilon subunit-like protein
MQSPFKKVIVYDLETGGLDFKTNAITEIAMVVIDLETLKVEDTFTTIIKPNYDLELRVGDSLKEAKAIFKAVAIKDGETKIPTLSFKGKSITSKNIEELVEDVSNFDDALEIYGTRLSFDQITKIESNPLFADAAKLYFDKVYNPIAMNVTHMTREMLVNEGVNFEDAIKGCADFINKYTIGNSKPILAGHNIKGFDNPFLEKAFTELGYDMYKMVNDVQMIDTLEWARLRWFDAPSFALGVCCNAVGVELKEAHRALPDTIANAEFLITMLKGLRGEGSQESTYEKRKFKFNF